MNQSKLIKDSFIDDVLEQKNFLMGSQVQYDLSYSSCGHDFQYESGTIINAIGEHYGLSHESEVSNLHDQDRQAIQTRSCPDEVEAESNFSYAQKDLDPNHYQSSSLVAHSSPTVTSIDNSSSVSFKAHYVEMLMQNELDARDEILRGLQTMLDKQERMSKQHCK